ncbi:MAG TPA: acetyl-CoA carboxylase biotin carboxylase subunit, partial [Anaerolineales bacterium]
KILIANRGEIAVRILRACRELHIPSVAVYSEADRRSLHVRMADEAVAIGPAESRESYLNIERIISAAKGIGAEAIHPGYGFLSENADFAQAVASAGLVFIGPSPEAIHSMGDKAEARKLMLSAGVPVVPGYQEADDEASLLHAAGSLVYPLLVKAAASGGGKGMRRVADAGELPDAIADARREALNAFGEGRLILEQLIPQAHHVEFQVLADQAGHCVHLFERECSIQRRHQKIIEETPSPLLDESLRAKMGAAATAAARAAGYLNAGTVEFIVNPQTRDYYFLEMNTRLQVEHPITEMVTGLDLVQWQIRIAAGEAFPYSQTDLRQNGHAIECRLYAEDPENGFLPASGKLLQFIAPAGPGVRIDSGFTGGDQITTFYDPMIAKLIVHAEDRLAALRRMQAALRDTVLLGVPTNWQFLQDVLSHPDFQAGGADTTWVEQALAGWQAPECPLPPEVILAAALVQVKTASLTQTKNGLPDPYSPWRQLGGFRLGE